MRAIHIIPALAAVLVCAAVLFATNVVRTDAPPAGQLEDRFFAGLDEFAATPEVSRSFPGPVVVIGIDGASWEFLNPLIDRGELPNLARLKSEGTHAPLRSVPCFFSPPAWVSMFTGYLPETTGIRTFGRWDRESRGFVSVNAEDVRVPSVWDVASYADRRVGVVNVPMTYPVREVNGIAVSGLMTPIDLERQRAVPSTRAHRGRIPVNESIESYSPVQRHALDDSLNSFLWSLYDTRDDGTRNYDRVSVTVRSKSDRDAADPELGTYTFELGTYSPWLHIRAMRGGVLEDAWCKMKVYENANGGLGMNLSPAFFRIDEAYAFPAGLDEHLREHFGYYLPTKFQQTDFVPHLAEESARYAAYLYDYDDWDFFAYVFTQSDNIHHLTGFSDVAVDVYRTIDRAIGEIMERLPPNGTLLVTSDHGFGKYQRGVDMNHFLTELGLLRRGSNGEVDYDNTLVFHNLWHLYFNHDILTPERLESHGVALGAGMSPADALAAHLERAVDGLGAGIRLERLPGGDEPDMLVHGASGDHFVEYWNLENPHGESVRDLVGGEQWEHTRDGILIAWGEPVRRGHALNAAAIEDVAPTILYLLGLPIAEDMDGSVITEMFEPRHIDANDRYVVSDYAQIDREQTPRERKGEDLEKKLRSLGYIR